MRPDSDSKVSGPTNRVADRVITQVTPAQARAQIATSKNRLKLWGIKAHSFSFPFGAYNSAVLDKARDIFDICLTSDEGLNVYESVAGQIQMLRVDASGKSFSTIKEWIDLANETGTWLILNYRSVGPGHSGEDDWVTNRVFRRTLKYIDNKQITVLPIKLAPPRY